MVDDTHPAPRLFRGVMVSSTFKDLEKHRAALMDALQKQQLHAIGMEDYVVVPEDNEISSSLRMVRESSAYIGLISHRYGGVIEPHPQNPLGYSVTRIEFEEAQGLELPTLVFVMGENHPVTKRDVETDPSKQGKLEEFRKRAQAGRIYVTFESLEEFERKAIHAAAELRRYLEERSTGRGASEAPRSPGSAAKAPPDPIPAPPAFYAEPPYIGSHTFVGRRAELEQLSDWASAANPHPVLLFEAIGGSGKSMLTWEWVTKHATEVRQDWAGRFWYSFYEKGAVMADFCRRALAYITGEPIAELRKEKTPALSERLLHHLQARPWLLVLDGLERLLVSYHRFDAAQLRDEEAGKGDAILQRDPCAAIRPEDEELLRALAGAAPSKLLLTSRLVPRVLLNQAGQPIPGVWRIALPGLRPADAEALARGCGVQGSSEIIQEYLQTHCDCHPLVTGVVAGLVLEYFEDRGSFDAWAADPQAGGRLNLGDLDLVQKKNHILRAALDALQEKGRELLSTLALLGEAVDTETLQALNPHLPPEPAEVPEPEEPELRDWWKYLTDEQKEAEREAYPEELKHRKRFEEAIAARLRSQEFQTAQEELKKTVHDLERRGLLQYDSAYRHYDLHPVVRGVAAGGLGQEERERYGSRAVDYFSSRSHDPYEEAETLDDVRKGLRLIRTLLQMGRFEQAYVAYFGALSQALLFNLEAYAETLALLRPFFPQGWGTLPENLKRYQASYVANDAALALREEGSGQEALSLFQVNITSEMKAGDWNAANAGLWNLANSFSYDGRLAKAERARRLALKLSQVMASKVGVFRSRLDLFAHLTSLGRWQEARVLWEELDPMGRNWSRATYQPGSAESWYCHSLFWQGELTEEFLGHAEALAQTGRNRLVLRALLQLRGQWQLARSEHSGASASFAEAVRMARETRKTDVFSETLLALAKLRLGELSDPRQEAERLSHAETASGVLAELWLAIGDRELAAKHALKAYKWAWSDGEPYVFRYELDRAKALLEQLGTPIPDLLPYDPAKDPREPWEAEVEAAIERLKAEKAAEAAKEAASLEGDVDPVGEID